MSSAFKGITTPSGIAEAVAPPAMQAPAAVPAAWVLERQGDTLLRRWSRAWGAFWLKYLFWHATHVPSVVEFTKPFFMFFVWWWGPKLRDNVIANARRMLGPGSTEGQQVQLAKRIIGNFYSFVYEVGRSLTLTPEGLRTQIDSIEGDDVYLAARAAGRGAILVTAHMGSFEVGVAALRDREEKIHVVFQRDRMPQFERLRTRLRQRLGVIEAPVDDGWTIWLRLRDALHGNEVVLMQGDRVMPGQKGRRVPFFDGHVMLPTGPIKLAMASGAPIVPLFAVKTPGGKVRISVEEPIYVEQSPDAADAALLKLAGLYERYVRQYPEQWFVMQRAWCEDQESAEQGRNGQQA
jgi:KDO2-lipid IV(A) lauroyltransferase